MSQLQQGNQPLPSKEANLLRQVVKFYESKQYKKGLKSADQILKKFPAHGETLAMKGLTLNCLDKKEEAYEYVRRGLQSDVKSHVCWHVYGLLYRSDRLYKKAITCYLNALKHDRDNIQILRDLALLQIQMRDLNGFLDTRHRLLQLRPNNRNNWIAFAIGHYLNKNYDVAVQVLSAYESTIEEIAKEEAYEHSEMLMLKATILEEAGCTEDAVELLDNSKGMIKDRLGRLEMRARLLMKLEMLDEARDIYRQLLKIFPDNYDYHRGLMKSLGIEEMSPGRWTPADQATLTGVYDELFEESRRSMACSRIPLDFKEGEAFIEAVGKYVAKFLNRGIPSLFSDLKPLYRSPEKAQALGKFFEDFRSRELDGSSPSSDDTSPQAIVWVLYYLSLHYDLMGEPELALERVAEALAHTPTVTELELARSKILKHVGDLPGSTAAADRARRLDLADRYLNCVAVKAAFRAGEIEEAENMAALFTKDENQISNLVEMQCMWYEIACGNAHLRNKDYGKALKKFLGVNKHFEDFAEDQFDFHGYCIRKMTLRSYIELLRMEDSLYGELTFSKAAWGAIQCYLDLHDDPSRAKQNTANASGPSGSDKESKRGKGAEKAKSKEKSKGKKSASSAVKVDPDPNGDLLIAVDDPLAVATTLVTMLRQHAGMRILTHKYAFEVYLRKKRMLLALSAVKRGFELEGRGSPIVHSMIIRFCQAVAEADSSVPEASSSDVASPADVVIREGVQELLEGSSLEDYNNEYLKKYGESDLVARISAAEMLVLLKPDEKQKCVDLIMEAGARISKEGWKEQDCQQVHELLKTSLGDPAAASKWKELCSKIFEWSSYFEGPKQTHITNGIVSGMEECTISDT